MNFLKKIWSAATKSATEKKLDQLEEHFWHIRNHFGQWLYDITQEDPLAQEDITPIEMELTAAEWDQLAEQHGRSPAHKAAEDIRAGDDVIEIYPFIGRMRGWVNAVALYNEIGITLRLTFDKVTNEETVIDLHTIARDGKTLAMGRVRAQDILKTRDFN